MLEFSMSLLDQAFFLVLGLIALICCFFGYRIFRLWLALTGFQIGFFICFSFGGQVFNPTQLLIIAILCGVLLAGGLCIFSRVGGVLAGAGVMALLVSKLFLLIPADLSAVSLYIYLAAMLIGALLGVLRIRMFQILTTAFAGGWLVSFCTGAIIAVWPVGQAVEQFRSLQGGGLILIWIGTAVLMICGTLVQLALKRRVRKIKAKPAAAAGPQSVAPNANPPDEIPAESVAEVIEETDEPANSES